MVSNHSLQNNPVWLKPKFCGFIYPRPKGRGNWKYNYPTKQSLAGMWGMGLGNFILPDFFISKNIFANFCKTKNWLCVSKTPFFECDK